MFSCNVGIVKEKDICFVTESGGNLTVVPADTDTFQINFEELEKLINTNTQGVIINIGQMDALISLLGNPFNFCFKVIACLNVFLF